MKPESVVSESETELLSALTLEMLAEFPTRQKRPLVEAETAVAWGVFVELSRGL